MKTVAMTALILALMTPFAPAGLGLLFFCVAVLAALSFKAHPVVSALAFSINILNTVMHIPGSVFPAEAFQGQILISHPEVGVHWIFLAAQIPVMTAAFYLLLTKDEPEEEDFIEGLKHSDIPKTNTAHEHLDIPEYRDPPAKFQAHTG